MEGAGLRSRLIAAGCLGAGAVIGAFLPGDPHVVTRLLVGWDIAVATFLVIMTFLMARSDLAGVKRHAAEYDEGRILVLSITLLAAAMSVVAIVLQLSDGRTEGRYGAVTLILVGATIALSWTLVHLAFALHYTHEYYAPDTEDRPGGLKFPGSAEPLYGDFVHFSFIIGCAMQTADIEITAPAMRRVSTAHSIAAFIFNMAIVALVINVGASLIGGK